MGLLPTKKSVKKTNDPKNLIIFGLPKAGKTTALSKLPDALIIDLENGTDYVDNCYVVHANDFRELHAVAKELTELKQNGTVPYKFLAFDTVTALEDMAIPLACARVKKTNPSFSGEPSDLFNLPYGQGFVAHRNAVKEMISWFEPIIPNIILTGHVKEKSLVEGGTDLNVKSLDLGGKLSNILSADSDAICYVYRDVETGNLMANFGDMNSVLTGSRIQSLAGKTILLAERIKNSDGNFDIETHWETIYPSLKNA